MAHKRVNGEGTIYRRKDGRYEAAVYVPTASGARKRVRIYARTRTEAYQRLAKLTAVASAGLPTPDRQVTLADYLDYWLQQFVKPNLRPKTYEQYELAVRLYLKPGLGARPISSLSVPMVQAYFNRLLAEDHSIRKVQILRTTLSAALTRAQREELLSRNVARLVELPQWERAEVHPWSADEATRFVEATRSHTLHAAFLLLVLYGMRRGEVLGLRWCDIDFDTRQLHIRQQLQRVGSTLSEGPVKTRAGQRDLPLLPIASEALLARQERQERACAEAGQDWVGSDGDKALVFTTRVGTPIEPRNFVRSYWRICKANDIRVIKLHHIRHTAATLMKDRGVPARDAQFILGHASSWLTEQVYQHDDMASRAEGLAKLEVLLKRSHDG